MPLVNGGAGSGQTIPPTSNVGTIDLITSTLGTITVTDPTGPTTNIEVTNPGGTVSDITSTGGSLVITTPTGPTVNLEVAASAKGISQLTGDVAAGPGSGSQAATLATVATAGTEGDASHTVTVQIDAKGRVLSLVQNLISITVSQISNLAATLAGYLALTGGAMTGAIAMGANKITGLANGTAATDAAAFGQIPVPANGYGITGNTGATPTPAVGLTVSQSFPTSPTAVAANTPTNLASLALAAGSYLINYQASLQVTAGTAQGEMWIAESSAGSTSAGSGTVAFFGASTHASSISGCMIVTLATPTTIYLVIESSGALTAQDLGTAENATGYMTGITALRYA